MQPLNQAERRKAFFNFLLFFLITSAFIISAVFFSIQVPAMENQQLRKKVEDIEREKDFNERFLQNVNETKILLDSLDKPESNVQLVDAKVATKLNQMQEMLNDSLGSFILYQDFIENIARLHTAKKELRTALSKDDSMGELQDQVRNLQSELQSYRTQLLLCENRRAE